MQYPSILFLSDTVANVRLTGAQAGRNVQIQKKGFKCPDLLILEPRNGYAGLFIELKTKSPYKVNGELKKDEHLEGQEKSLNDLTEKGYKAVFAWTFDMVKKLIDEYLK